LIAHRALARQLGWTKNGPPSRDLSRLGDHISNTERAASDAERESIRLKKLDYLEAQQTLKKKKHFKAQIIVPTIL
jgi:exoribonuclease R